MAIYTLGLLLMKCISLIMMPIVTRYLNLTEFGTLEILLIFINLASLIFGVGLSDALYKYAGLEKNAFTIEKWHTSAIVISIAVSLVFASVLFVLSPTISAILPGDVKALHIKLLSIILALGSFLAVQLSWLRISETVNGYLLVTVGMAASQAIGVVIFLNLGQGINSMLYASILSLSLAVALSLKFSPISFKYIKDIPTIHKLVKYGYPLIFAGVLSFLYMGSEQWWLGFLLGVEELAIYSIACKFSMITLFALQPFMMWWGPKRFKLYGMENGLEKIATISTYGVTVGFIAAILIAAISKIIIFFMLPEAYHAATEYVLPLSLIFAVKNISDTYNFGIYLKASHWVIWINGITAIIASLGFYLLIPIFDLNGTLIAMLLAFSVRSIIMLWISQHLLNLNYPYKKFSYFMSAIIFSVYLLQNSTGIYQVITLLIPSLCLLILLAIQLKILPQLSTLFNRAAT